MQFGTAPAGDGSLRWCMAIERSDLEEQQARLDTMIEEFRIARQRRLEKQSIAQTNRSLTRPPAAKPGVPPAKLN